MPSHEKKPRRRRGVPLNALDRSKRYVIGHVGTRWEVLGEFAGPASDVAGWAGADAEGVSTARAAAPEPDGGAL